MIRVVSGKARGRILRVPRGQTVRPTPQRVREALFDILGEAVSGSVFLDCFAGTGAVGIEALSRGARQAIFVEWAPTHLRILQENLRRCKLENRARILRGDVLQLARRGRLPEGDILFLDPPYEGISPTRLLQTLARHVNVKKFVIYEHSRHQTLPQQVGRWIQIRRYPYGDTGLTFYGVLEEEVS